MTKEDLEQRLVQRAVEEIGSCLVSIGMVLQQGCRDDNQALRGGVAVGLERAAAYMRGSLGVMSVVENEGTTTITTTVSSERAAAEPVMSAKDALARLGIEV